MIGSLEEYDELAHKIIMPAKKILELKQSGKIIAEDYKDFCLILEKLIKNISIGCFQLTGETTKAFNLIISNESYIEKFTNYNSKLIITEWIKGILK